MVRGARRASRKPVILFIDDVHWADSASLALVHYIARTIYSERVLVLATFRSEQLVPDAELQKLMPQRTAVVEVTLTNGKTVSERVGTVRGTAANPMTKDEVIAKARDLIVPVLGSGTFEKLADRIFAIESVKSVTELRPLISLSQPSSSR